MSKLELTNEASAMQKDISAIAERGGRTTTVEQLIQQYCPDGVEYVKLGDFATDWYRGAGIKKDEVSPDGMPCIRYGEIHTTYKIWFDKCISHTDENNQPSKKYADYGDILFAITSEDIPFIGNSVAYVGKERILVGGDIVVMKHTQNPKYISYALSTIDAVRQKGKGKVKSKVVHTSVPSLQNIVIPLPPLPVQEEVARMLDLFAELQTELQTELQAELQKRKQQYNYYKGELLSFGGRKDVKYVPLSSIADLVRGKVISKDYIKDNEGVYPVYSSQTENDGVMGRISTYMYDGSFLTWTTDGAYAGTIFRRSGKFNITNVCGLVKIKDSGVNMDFLFYWLSSEAPKYVYSGMGNPKLMSNVMGTISVPILPLAEQQKIVDILDRFDTLTNDLAAGLPAEIEKRRQQYEYYRDKLLTFKRKES